VINGDEGELSTRASGKPVVRDQGKSKERNSKERNSKKRMNNSGMSLCGDTQYLQKTISIVCHSWHAAQMSFAENVRLLLMKRVADAGNDHELAAAFLNFKGEMSLMCVLMNGLMWGELGDVKSLPAYATKDSWSKLRKGLENLLDAEERSTVDVFSDDLRHFEEEVNCYDCIRATPTSIDGKNEACDKTFKN
jgi:hypothetical protein